MNNNNNNNGNNNGANCYKSLHRATILDAINWILRGEAARVEAATTIVPDACGNITIRASVVIGKATPVANKKSDGDKTPAPDYGKMDDNELKKRVEIDGDIGAKKEMARREEARANNAIDAAFAEAERLAVAKYGAEHTEQIREIIRSVRSGESVTRDVFNLAKDCLPADSLVFDFLKVEDEEPSDEQE